MSWSRPWAQNWSSNWRESSSSNQNSGWNSRNRQQSSRPSEPSLPENPVSIPQNFRPDRECYDSNSVSGKKFFRNVQNTPWSSKAGLAGKDVSQIRLVDVTRKGLDDFALRNLSNGEFQGVVFVRSVSEAVFVTNFLRLLRQDKIDIDKTAAHLHGEAPPDRHKESARFMEPLLGELMATVKRLMPSEPVSESDELTRAKRKLAEAGLELSPPVKRRVSEFSEPSSSARKDDKSLPVEESPAEAILAKPIASKPATLPTANTQAAIEKWLKSHQSQFRGHATAFKKHVSEVSQVLTSSGINKTEFVSCAARYGLNEKLAARLSISNLSTFIAACQFQAA